jgi:hypothetical protein
MAEFPSLERDIGGVLRGCQNGDHWDNAVLHASDLFFSKQGGGCKRAFYLRLKGATEREPTVGKLWMFDRGHSAEERIEGWLRENLSDGWHLTRTQVTVSYEGIGGTLDFWLENEDGTTCVIDCKTARGNAFTEGRLLSGPKEAHVLQVSFYAIATGADLAGLFYCDREGSNGFVQWEVVPDKEAVDQAIGEIRQVQHLGYEPAIMRPNVNIRENKGPDSVTIKEPWQCSYCDYRGMSCDGAIPPHLRDEIPDKGLLVGHQQADGTFKPRAGVSSGLVNLTKALL